MSNTVVTFESPLSLPYQLCSEFVMLCLVVEENAEYEVKVKEVDISPYPIARGEPATFTISATTGCFFTLTVLTLVSRFLFLNEYF